MSESPSFLEEEPVVAPEAAIEPAPEPQPEPQPEPEPAPEPQPETGPEPQPEPPLEPAPVEPDPARSSPHVPLAAHLDERDKRQRAEAELERLRAAQPVQPQEPAAIPDPYEDPQGYIQFVRAENAREAQEIKLGLSQSNATRFYGQEEVNKGLQWFFAQPPAVQEEIKRSPDPYEIAVQQARRAEAYSAINDPSEVQAFLAWKAANAQAAAQPLATAQPAPAPAAPPQQPSPIPPRSLVSAPSAGGVQTQVEAGDPFDEEFKRKK